MKRPSDCFNPPYGCCMGDIDKEIKSLVLAMNDGESVTSSSCCGHMEKNAYVAVAVYGTKGLQRFTQRMNYVGSKFKDGYLWMDLHVTWSEEILNCVSTAHPNWICLELSIQEDFSPPSPVFISKIAKLWKASRREIKEPKWDKNKKHNSNVDSCGIVFSF